MLDAIPVALDGRRAHARGAGRRGGPDHRHRGPRRQAARAASATCSKPAAFRGDLCFAPSDGQRRALRPAGSVAGAVGAGRHRRGDARGRPPLPVALRPGEPRGARALVRDALAGRGRALAQAARRRGGGGRARGSATCSPPTWRPPRRRAGGRRAAPAGLRPLRRRRAARQRRRGGARTRAARVPAAGLAVAGAGRRRPDRRGVVARAHRASGLEVAIEPFGRRPAGACARAPRPRRRALAAFLGDDDVAVQLGLIEPVRRERRTCVGDVERAGHARRDLRGCGGGRARACRPGSHDHRVQTSSSRRAR